MLVVYSCEFLMSIYQVVGNISKVFPKDTEASPGGVDDMTKLSYLHEPGVLQNLGARYELNEIYVSFLCLTISRFSFFFGNNQIFMSLYICCRHILEIF